MPRLFVASSVRRTVLFLTSIKEESCTSIPTLAKVSETPLITFPATTLSLDKMDIEPNRSGVEVGWPGVHHLVVADDVAGAFNSRAAERIAIEPQVFQQVPGGTCSISEEEDPSKEPTDRAVADGDVAAVKRSDAVGKCCGAGRQATELEAVHVDGDVVGRDGDHIAARQARCEVAHQAVDALHGDNERDRIDHRAVDGLGLGRCGHQGAGQANQGHQAFHGGVHRRIRHPKG